MVTIHTGTDFSVVIDEKMIHYWKEEDPLKEKIEKSEESRERFDRRVLKKTDEIICMKTEEIDNKKEVAKALAEYGDTLNAIRRTSIYKLTCLGKKRNENDQKENTTNYLPENIDWREHTAPIDKTDRVLERNASVFFRHWSGTY
jgi:hypothetical protein